MIGYQFIKQYIIDYNINEVGLFMAYFEKNYIGTIEEGSKNYRSPLYEIAFWNVYDRVLLNIPRTSNNAETWNRTFNLRTVVANPNIAQFIMDVLREEEADIFNIKRALNGKFQLRKDYEKEEKLRICVENYHHFNISAYLGIIMSHYNFKFEDEDS